MQDEHISASSSGYGAQPKQQSESRHSHRSKKHLVRRQASTRALRRARDGRVHRPAAHPAYTLAVDVEQDERGAADAEAERGEDRVALAVSERVVHVRREQREAEARERAEARHGREGYTWRRQYASTRRGGKGRGVPEAAYCGKESMTYACRPWKVDEVPAPMSAKPCARRQRRV